MIDEVDNAPGRSHSLPTALNPDSPICRTSTSPKRMSLVMLSRAYPVIVTREQNYVGSNR